MYTDLYMYLKVKTLLESVLLETIFDEQVTLGDLVQLVIILAVLVFLYFELLRPFVSKLASGALKPKLMFICEQEFNRSDKIEEQELFGVTTKKEYFDVLLLGFWPDLMLILTQHLIGGAFTLPAVFGWETYSPSVASSLACLGILIEMGWEVQDLARMVFYRLLGGKEGKKKYPIGLIVILCIHHSLTCCMALPMVLRYRNLRELHLLCFNLQFSGALVGFGTQYSRFLDVTQKNHLIQFTFVSFLMVLMLLWTRVIDWLYLSYRLLSVFYSDQEWTFLIVGACCVLVFSIFNMAFFTLPICKRFTKFAKKLIEHERLSSSSDADRGELRRSIVGVQSAAADLTAIETSRLTLLHLLFEDRRVERRHTSHWTELSRSAALAASSVSTSARNLRLHRQSMVAWRALPSGQTGWVARVKRD